MSVRPKFAFMLSAALVAGGCVTIPLPPLDGEKTKAGDWGSIRVLISYVPNLNNIVQSYKEWKKPTQ